jgi:hypothetical protein
MDDVREFRLIVEFDAQVRKAACEVEERKLELQASRGIASPSTINKVRVDRTMRMVPKLSFV